jgi:integrase
LAERQKGLLHDPNRQTVGEFLERWLRDTAAPTLVAKTLETYAHIVRRYIVPALGRLELAKLSPQHLQQLYREKREAGLTRTVEMIHAVLHVALARAAEWGLVPRNVAEHAQPTRVRARDMRALTPDEARAFLEAAKEDRLNALYVLAIACGLRQGELLGLRWSDIDMDGGTVHVQRSLGWVSGQWLFTEGKTAKSRRTVVLPRIAVAALKKHRAVQAVERLVLGEAWAHPDLVFTTTVGTPIGKSVLIRRSFKPILQKAGLPRHSAATMLLAAGENPKVVQELLGHSRISITLDTYSHVIPSLQRQVAEKMDNMLAITKPKA